MAPSSKKRPATKAEAAPEADLPTEAEPEGKKIKYSDAEMRSQCTAYFKTVASGARKASQAQIDEAKKATEVYRELGPEDKTLFAKAFFTNKGTKTFGFIRDYTEKITAKKSVREHIAENYFTRIVHAPI